MRILILFISGVTLLCSCMREEIPVEAFDIGDVLLTQVEMHPDYRDQVWFDLGRNEVVSINKKISWDLAFSCSDSISVIYLNTSLGMQAADTEQADFEKAINEVGLNFRADHQSGHSDSLVLKDAITGNVYVIDRGYSPSGSRLDKWKFQLVDLKDNIYQIVFGQLDGEDYQTLSVPKDDRYNTVSISFIDAEVKYIEPQKDAYDIVFTQYVNVFYDPDYLPYLVTGTLSNPYLTEVGIDTLMTFEDIKASRFLEINFSQQRNKIGFDWKSFSLETNTFTVYPHKNYLIRDSEGFLYKLHFVDFYNKEGLKGYPTFEYRKL